jgi:voltage-gated potassium channel
VARYRLVIQAERLLDGPANFLALVFAVALGTEIVLAVQGDAIPAWLGTVQLLIWGFFGLQFAFGLAVAPSVRRYLRRHWLTAISLVLPFVRVLRVARLAAALRAVRLARLVTGANRLLRSVRRTLAWNGAGYALGIAATVALFGSVALFMFEADAGTPGLGSYGDVLWWTLATLTTVGGSAEPATLGGRAVGLLVMAAGLVLFGYIAALAAAVLFRQEASRRRP